MTRTLSKLNMSFQMLTFLGVTYSDIVRKHFSITCTYCWASFLFEQEAKLSLG